MTRSDPDAESRPPRGGASDGAQSGPGGAPDADRIPVDSRTRADRRSGHDRRQADAPVGEDRRSGRERRQGGDRRRSDRKRSINEYTLSDDARELAEAVARFRRDHDNRFPTIEQLLRLLRDLGYEKREAG